MTAKEFWRNNKSKWHLATIDFEFAEAYAEQENKELEDKLKYANERIEFIKALKK